MSFIKLFLQAFQLPCLSRDFLSADRFCRGGGGGITLLYSQEALFHDIIGGSYTAH